MSAIWNNRNPPLPLSYIPYTVPQMVIVSFVRIVCNIYRYRRAGKRTLGVILRPKFTLISLLILCVFALRKSAKLLDFKFHIEMEP